MGKTLLSVEQNVYKALSIADRAYVLEQGKISMEGTAKAIAEHPNIRKPILPQKKIIKS